MDWMTEIAEDLITRIYNADSEDVVRGVEFIDWTGPIKVEVPSYGDGTPIRLPENEEGALVMIVKTVSRPFTASIDGELDSFRLVIDVLEGRAWVSSGYCRLSPIRDIRMRKVT